MWEIFPHHAVLCNTKWASCDSIQVWHDPARDSSWTHRLRTQSHKTSYPTSDANHTSRLSPISLNQMFPWWSLQVPLICYSGPQNSGKPFTYIYCFIIKGDDQGYRRTFRRERYTGWGLWERCRTSRLSPHSPTLMLFKCPWDFNGDFITQDCLLSHW